METKRKMYSLRCNQCGKGFLSSFALEAPVCGNCMQKIKSSDSTIDYDKNVTPAVTWELFMQKHNAIHVISNFKSNNIQMIVATNRTLLCTFNTLNYFIRLCLSPISEYYSD